MKNKFKAGDRIESQVIGGGKILGVIDSIWNNVALIHYEGGRWNGIHVDNLHKKDKK